MTAESVTRQSPLALPEPIEVDRFPLSKCWEICTDGTPAGRTHIGVRVDHECSIKINAVGTLTAKDALHLADSLYAAVHYKKETND